MWKNDIKKLKDQPKSLHIFFLQTEFSLFFCLNVIFQKKINIKSCLFLIESPKRISRYLDTYLKNCNYIEFNGSPKAYKNDIKNIIQIQSEFNVAKIYSDRFHRNSLLRNVKIVSKHIYIKGFFIFPDGVSFSSPDINFESFIVDQVGNIRKISKSSKITLLLFEKINLANDLVGDQLIIELKPIKNDSSFRDSILIIGGELGISEKAIMLIIQNNPKTKIYFKKHPVDQNDYNYIKKLESFYSALLMEDILFSNQIKGVYGNFSTLIYLANKFKLCEQTSFIYDSTNLKDNKWLPVAQKSRMNIINV